MAQLQLYKEFKQILGSYQISERARASLQGLRLVLMLGASSTGRNTLIRHLVETGRYHYLISDTTRRPRVNDGILEQNGREYWFRSEPEMLSDLRAGEFLEAELIHDQQVSGISIRELQKAKQEHKAAVTDIDIQGMHNVVRVKPDTVAIMLLPPSFEEWQRRITRRGAMSQEEVRRRLLTAERIFSNGLSHDFYRYVIAEDVEQSTAIIEAIIKGGANPHQDRGRELLSSLQSHLQQKLSAS